ncbi:TRAP transporter TatT component family protein [Myxococcota bacterium]|nr:TRAP transporter TatT component family protein [Myxococcota bacterium]
MLRGAPWLALAALTSLSGCASLATGALADALSGSGGSFATDDDPELVGDAIPFALKTMESVLVEQPEHLGLLTALASGFAQYGYAFVEQEADRVADTDIDRALALRLRARKLYLRAKEYGMRGLEVSHPGFRAKLAANAPDALSEMEKDDVPLLYWTAAAWGLAIGAAKDDPAIFADFPKVGPIAARALELDPDWNEGALHELFITYEASAPEGSVAKAREHFAKALALSGGRRAGPYVTLAEKVSIKEQNAKEFHQLLDKALAVDLDASPKDRLANVLVKRRAERLKKAAADLFLDDGSGGDTAEPATN